MPIKVPVPDLGVSVVEAMVAEWKKNVGDDVVRDEEIGILETDKITTPITAFKEGKLVALFAKPGDTVPVGQTIAIIQKVGESLSQEDIDQLNPHGLQPTPEPTPELIQTNIGTQRKSSTPQSLKTSPAVRRYANENDINLGDVQGTGSNGRIQMADVLAFKKPIKSTGLNLKPDNTESRSPVSSSMAVMAKHMVHSVSTSPHFLIVDELDMTETLAVYKNLKPKMKENGIRLTLMSFFVRAAAQALKDFPRMNVSLEKDTLVTKNYRNIGMAASVGESLIVPVIKNADLLNIENLATEINNILFFINYFYP